MRPAGRTCRAGCRPRIGLGVALALLLVAGALSGCVQPMVNVDTAAQVGAQDVILVGRVELVPPFKPEEQKIDLAGPYNDKNQFFFYLNNKPVAVPDSPEQTPHDDILMEKFGSTFYVQHAQKPVYFSIAMVYMTLTSQNQEMVWLPGGFMVDVKPGDRAVYIGTIRYHRNEFFDIKKVELSDDFQREQAAFRKKFGDSLKLVKHLAHPYKS
jgi:hypothetical protein